MEVIKEIIEKIKGYCELESLKEYYRQFGYYYPKEGTINYMMKYSGGNKNKTFYYSKPMKHKDSTWDLVTKESSQKLIDKYGVGMPILGTLKGNNTRVVFYLETGGLITKQCPESKFNELLTYELTHYSKNRFFTEEEMIEKGFIKIIT